LPESSHFGEGTSMNLPPLFSLRGKPDPHAPKRGPKEPADKTQGGKSYASFNRSFCPKDGRTLGSGRQEWYAAAAFWSEYEQYD
jgi:hypothetical protein